MLDSKIQSRLQTHAEDFHAKLHLQVAHRVFDSQRNRYRYNPAGFAREVLKSNWWPKQTEVARLLANNRRVAVKSGNGVGKTYLAADIALWFLYTHPGAVVLTSAPTARQVKHVLWQEIRRRWGDTKVPLPGRLLQTRIEVDRTSFAMGQASDMVKAAATHVTASNDDDGVARAIETMLA